MKRNLSFLNQHPLAQYAASFWWKHVRNALSLDPNHAIRLASSASYLLTECSSALCTWLELLGVNEAYPAVSRMTPLSYAAWIGIPQLIIALLSRVVDVYTEGGVYSETPLYRAAEMGHEEVVRILVGAGADPNVGKPLSVAVEAGHVKIARTLLEAGADAKGYDRRYGSTLALACAFGHVDIAQMLLNAGANVAGSYSRGSPLWHASRNGHKAVVQILIRAGADPDERVTVLARFWDYGSDLTIEQSTAVLVATQQGHDGIVQILVKAGANTDL